MNKNKECDSLLIKKILLIVSSIILAAAPFYFMVIKGPFKWHIQQPAFWQGGLVLVVFIALTTLLWTKYPNRAFEIILCSGMFYLFINGVIIPFLVDYIYVAILCYIGSAALSIKKDEIKTDIIRSFVAGISVWGAVAIVFSLFKMGTFLHLRIMTMVLFTIAVIFSRKKKYTFILCRIKNSIISIKKSNYSYLMYTILVFVFLSLMAKTNTALDYDSLWYGLRPQSVLVGEHSFYDNLGLTSFIYFYPKLMELLYLPISNLGDYSFIIIMNIIIMIMFIVAISRSMKMFLKWDFATQLQVLPLLASIPAITSIAATGKPDILGAFFVFCAWMYFYQYFINKHLHYLLFAIICLILCTGTKPTYILWGGILFISACISIAVFWREKNNRPTVNGLLKSKNEIIILASSFLLILGVHYRTFIFTGYPVYPVFLSVFNRIGFKAKYPFMSSFTMTSMVPESIMAYIRRIYEFFINPTSLHNVVMIWPSSLLIVLLMSVFVFPNKEQQPDNKAKRIYHVVVCLLMGLVMVFYIETQPQPDGNYFILPIILLIMSCLERTSLFSINNTGQRLKNFTKVICSVFLIVQLPLMFVSHPSWAWGTKSFTPLVVIDNFESSKDCQEYLTFLGYNKISQYLKEHPQKGKILFSNTDAKIYGRIPGIIESQQGLMPYFADDSLFDSYDNFVKYIRHTSVAGFVIDHNDDSQFRIYALQFLSEYGYSIAVNDDAAALYLF